jgi:glycosyltransferase involved in cell wall biosynthesis
LFPQDEDGYLSPRTLRDNTVIFINQFVGELFADVVDILRCLPGPHMLIAGRVTREWDDVRWLQSCPLQKTSVVKRIITWGTFTAQTFLFLMRYARNQPLLFVSNPPIAMWMAPFFRRYYDCTYSLLIYDIYPDTFLAARMLFLHFLLVKIWRKLNAFTLRRAKHIITLSAGMAHTLQAQMPEGERLSISVIENWGDSESFQPIPKIENPLIPELRLLEKFVVGYTGAFGATHGVDILIESAYILRQERGIHFLLVGGGTEEYKIQKKLQKASFVNITHLPFQTHERFRYIAAIPDISVILTNADSGNTMLPSKLYTAMAAGSAILAVADQEGDLARSVQQYGYGVVTAPGDAQALAETILYLYREPNVLENLRKRARDTVVAQYSKWTQCQKYQQLFDPDDKASS